MRCNVSQGVVCLILCVHVKAADLGVQEIL